MSLFPILMYHALELPAAPPPLAPRGPTARRYTLAFDVFEAQLDDLVRAGVRTPRSWAEVDDPAAEPGTVWLTFDDGHASDCELALPALQRRGLRGIFFITTDWIGRPGFMTADQVRALRRAGMLLGTHGRSHRFFSRMNAAEARAELADSRHRLEEILGEPVGAVSLPGGRAHARMRELAREAGYGHVFTSVVALADPRGDPLSWPRLPITRDLKENLVRGLLRGEPGAVARLARRARLRAWVRGLLGRD